MSEERIYSLLFNFLSKFFLTDGTVCVSPKWYWVSGEERERESEGEEKKIEKRSRRDMRNESFLQ